MRIDTSSRPPAFVGMEYEREKMENWFKAYQEFDPDARIIVEENNTIRNGDLLFYFTSNDTLKEIQESAMIAKKKLTK